MPTTTKVFGPMMQEPPKAILLVYVYRQGDKLRTVVSSGDQIAEVNHIVNHPEFEDIMTEQGPSFSKPTYGPGLTLQVELWDAQMSETTYKPGLRPNLDWANEQIKTTFLTQHSAATGSGSATFTLANKTLDQIAQLMQHAIESSDTKERVKRLKQAKDILEGNVIPQQIIDAWSDAPTAKALLEYANEQGKKYIEPSKTVYIETPNGFTLGKVTIKDVVDNATLKLQDYKEPPVRKVLNAGTLVHDPKTGAPIGITLRDLDIHDGKVLINPSYVAPVGSAQAAAAMTKLNMSEEQWADVRQKQMAQTLKEMSERFGKSSATVKLWCDRLAALVTDETLINGADYQAPPIPASPFQTLEITEEEFPG